MLMSTLPIEHILPSLLDALATHPCVVLSAAPGAGKTTCVPLAVLASQQHKGRILMLEPRRLAAARAAQYMADLLGEPVGETVGYRIRGDSRCGARTRIEVVTEGILTRLLQHDPALTGISLVIFDEFHERSLQADLGLALTRDCQLLLREDLKLLVMSATLDGIAVSKLLGNAPVIESSGRSHPVNLLYTGQNKHKSVEQEVADTVRRALLAHPGDVLAFLPGQREIRRAHSLLSADSGLQDIVLHTLYGEATNTQQQTALLPDPANRRKVILATSIAETSLTIDGVSLVIDSGLVRTIRFDPRRGMSGLVTLPVSQATAEQRAGRAGRQQPGWCYRLWAEDQQSLLARYPTPEILHSDLMPMALELAAWGTHEDELAFLDPPPPAHLQQARSLLLQLGALDPEYRITPHGREIQGLPTHPRIGHMLLRAREKDLGPLACDVAALLEERDLLRGERDANLYLRWQALRHGGTVDRAARERVKQQAGRLRGLLGIHEDTADHSDRLGLMIALCYPERIARRRDARGERWLLAGGTGGLLPAGNSLSQYEWIAIAEVDGEGRDTRIQLAAALDLQDITEALPEQYTRTEETRWSATEQAVLARRITRVGAIVLEETPLPLQHGTAVTRALCEGIRSLGWQTLPLSEEATHWLTRLRWARQYQPEWPDCSDATLLATLENWLGPYLNTVSKVSQLPALDWNSAVQNLLDYKQQQHLALLAPSHLTVPTGSRIALDYSGEHPVLAVRLQELFGLEETPCIAEGRIPVLLHLLSPARRPLAVTQDLASFWKNAWKDVRKDMRGQYKRHYWPENPLEAEPTRRTKAADDRAARKT
jgi:ATP-dependent helicase HrpB